MTLYIWIGTCDLTTKTGHKIELRSEDFASVNRLCSLYKQIYDFLREYPTLTVIFLELPYYSIYHYNGTHEQPNLEQFRSQDKILQSQINEVNKYIRSLNSLMHKDINSPNFGLDLEKPHKSVDKSKGTYSLNYGLYVDGVHPHPDLAKLWLIRLSLRFENDCA